MRPSQGAKVNARRRGGQTALLAACANGFAACAHELLVRWGADATITRDDGAGPLHAVVEVR